MRKKSKSMKINHEKSLDKRNQIRRRRRRRERARARARERERERVKRVLRNSRESIKRYTRVGAHCGNLNSTIPNSQHNKISNKRFQIYLREPALDIVLLKIWPEIPLIISIGPHQCKVHADGWNESQVNLFHVLDFDIILSRFEFYLSYDIYFRTLESFFTRLLLVS